MLKWDFDGLESQPDGLLELMMDRWHLKQPERGGDYQQCCSSIGHDG